jgi:hypothetical protein
MSKPLFTLLVDLFKNAKENEYRRGQTCAAKLIATGSDPVVLLNQARSSLTYDMFDRGWRDCCEETIKTAKDKDNG